MAKVIQEGQKGILEFRSKLEVKTLKESQFKVVG